MLVPTQRCGLRHLRASRDWKELRVLSACYCWNAPGGGSIIEDDVSIGANAVLLGNIVIHKGAKIGAGAVVLCDVPESATAVGVPARIITTSEM